jgi:hypothetical protein
LHPLHLATKRFSEEIASGTKRGKNVLKQLALDGLR